jgi:tryptophan-rich sensory protein
MTLPPHDPNSQFDTRPCPTEAVNPDNAQPARRLGIDSLVAALAVIIVAGTGGALTRLDEWYFALKQPAFKPPDWVFGPAWTLLFFLIAWAAVVGWRAGARLDPSPRRRMLLLFAINGLANVGWSLLYFFLRRPDWALAEVVILWGSILALILHFRAYAPRAALLLVPYLLWVSFAALLNFEAVRLNP